MVIYWLPRVLQRDDTIREVDAALGRYLEVALGYVAKEGIRVERATWLLLEGAQSGQAFDEFVQAPFDTAELDLHSHLPQ